MYSTYTTFSNLTIINREIFEMFKDGVPDKIVYFSKDEENLPHFIGLMVYFFLPTDVYYNAQGSHTPIEADEMHMDAGDSIQITEHNYDDLIVPRMNMVYFPCE
jgi:hypothetical protein